jgi:transcriptional regulator with XRE-family HTH domain
MKKTFAERMREGMRIRRMRQVDLCEATGLSKSAISQYYSGKHEPRQDGIYLIAKALNVDEAWLMGYDVNIWTQKELEQIENFKEYLVLKRDRRDG